MDAITENSPGRLAETWEPEFLNKLAKLLARYNTLLKTCDKTQTQPLCRQTLKQRRRAANQVARALAPPRRTPAQVYKMVADFKELYRDKSWLLSGASPRPAWMRAVERHLAESVPPPDAAERVLLALTERARALRCTEPAAVCRALEEAPHARASDLACVWLRMVDGVRAKLHALIAGGDSETGLQAGARLSRAEWRLVDALLLYDDSDTLAVVREEHARRAEPLRALVAVFHLVQLYRLEEGGGAGAWRAAAAAYRRRGRVASAVLLQRRWHDLKRQTRARLAGAARGARDGPRFVLMPAPLHVAVARRFPHVALEPLPCWRRLVASAAVLEECDLTAGRLDALPASVPEPDWTRLEAAPSPAPAASDGEDDLILVEREVETIDLLADGEEGGGGGGHMEAAQEGCAPVKREVDAAPDEAREALRARRREMALALERELDRQLRDLDGGLGAGGLPVAAPVHPPLIIYESDESGSGGGVDSARSEDEAAQGRSEDEEAQGRSEDEEAQGRREDEEAQGRSEDEEAQGRSEDESSERDDEEPTIDPKLLMTTLVPLIRVDAPGWRDLRAPPHPEGELGGEQPDHGNIRIVAVKSEAGEVGEGGRRTRIRLPDIAEVRRINRGMKTAQVAPLVSCEEELRVEPGSGTEEGGTLTGLELQSVLQGWSGRCEGRGAAGSRWRELYCCAARYHRALNDARRRCAARGGRVPPPDAPVHAARCARRAQEGGDACKCCCAHLLDAEGAARALAADRAALLQDVRAILAGTYTAPPAHRTSTEDSESAMPQAPPKIQKKKKTRPPREAVAEPPPPPAEDPLQEWIRQKNLTSRFFDLNLKKPPSKTRVPLTSLADPSTTPLQVIVTPLSAASPKSPASIQEPPSNPLRLIVTPLETSVATAKPPTASLGTPPPPGSTDPAKRKTPNKVKVTVRTRAGSSCRSVLLGGGGAEAIKRVPGGEYLLRGGKRAREEGALEAPHPPDEVIDLCDEDEPPAPPAARAPPSLVLLKKLPAGISVKRKGLPPPDQRAQRILSSLPPGIQVKRRALLAPAHAPAPAPAPVLLNERMPPAQKEDSNIKVFKISEDGLLTPSAAATPRRGARVVLLPRRRPPGSVPVSQAQLLDLVLARVAAGNNANITEMRTSDGKRLLMLRPPVDGRPGNPVPADGRPDNLAPADGRPGNLAPTDGRPDNLAPADGRLGNLAPADGRPGKLAPADGQSGNLRPADGRPGNLAPTDGRPDNLAPADGRPGNLAPTDGRPDNLAPADGRPGNLAPADGRPGKLASADGQSGNLRPTDGRPDNLAPTDVRPDNLAPADGRPGNLAPADGRPCILVPADGRPGSLVPADGRPGSLAPADGRPGNLVPADGRPGNLAPVDEPRVQQLLDAGKRCGAATTTPEAFDVMFTVADSTPDASVALGNTATSPLVSSPPSASPAPFSVSTGASVTTGTIRTLGSKVIKLVVPKIAPISTPKKVTIPRLLSKIRETIKTTGRREVTLLKCKLPSKITSSTSDALAPTPLPYSENICTFETGSGGNLPGGDGSEEVVMELEGGATVRRAEPSHNFSEPALSVQQWSAPLVQVAERGAHYRAGAYYVRTGRPLPCARAAVWTTGPEAGCERLVLRAPPLVRRRQRACFLRLAAGVSVRAEWVCRNVRDVVREARAGADLSVVHAPTGHAHPLYSVRPPRPGLLALRCKYLAAAQLINKDVNQFIEQKEGRQSYVRIAAQPPPRSASNRSSAPAPAPAPALAAITIKRNPEITLKKIGAGQSLLKPLIPNEGLEKSPTLPETCPERPDTPPMHSPSSPVHSPSSPVHSPSSPVHSPSSPVHSPSSPARPEPPAPEPRRSSRRAAHDARAKLTDLMKELPGGGESSASAAGYGGGDEGLDYSTAAGHEPADSDEDYDVDDDLRERKDAHRGGGRGRAPPRASHGEVDVFDIEGEGDEPVEEHLDEGMSVEEVEESPRGEEMEGDLKVEEEIADDMEIDDDLGGGIII